jgi:hypothetical protein
MSTDRLPDVPPGLQRALLAAEGIEFKANGTLDLTRYRWSPGASIKPKRRVSRRRT